MSRSGPPSSSSSSLAEDPLLAADSVRRAEERLSRMVASVKDYAIFMLDEAGHVQSWNAGAESMKGYVEAEILGKHISTFYPPADRQAGRPESLLERAVRDGRVEDEGWRVGKDGTRFWADVVITALKDEAGELLGFTKVTRDLTERRKANEALRLSEERFRLLVESVKDQAIVMLDPHGRVTTWNAGAERLKGYTRDEIIGLHYSRFYLPEESATGAPDRHLEEALEKGRFEAEGWRVRKNGTRFYANGVIEPLRNDDGTLIGFAKITQDLTARRVAETDRLRAVQAEEEVRLRDEFLSIASHELRTPLTAVLIQLEGLVKTGVNLERDRLQQQLARAHRAGQRLGSLVETLLDVSRIASGRMQLRLVSFDLVTCLRDVAESFRESALRTATTFLIFDDGRVDGCWDRLRLEQVFSNLFSNALKYAPGTTIEITVERHGDDAVVHVDDRGPGIPEADRERVFGRFERAVSVRHYGGLGLGLYVAREIIEAHRGTLVYVPNEPHGARFTVRMPVDVEKAGGVRPSGRVL